MRRAVTIVASALAAAIGMVTPVAGAVLWTILGAPVTATVFQSTTYTFTATNLLFVNEIGCVEIQLPDSYVIDALGDPSASNGDDWIAEIYGGTNWVLVHSTSGGGRLELLESVTFTVQATATQTGAQIWNTHAHRQQDCSGAEIEPGVWPAGVAPVLLPTPPPPPPTPVPTPALPPIPTPPPLPIDPEPSGTPTPTETHSPTPSASPLPALEGVGPATPPSASGAAQTVGRLAPFSDGQTSSFGIGTEVFALLDGPLLWFIPGAAVAVPGLLVVLFIALQALGALAWVPAVRRMSGDPVPIRRRRRPGD
ncbi:MAG TPA: hypothetical protein VFP83_06930 [Candidatus Limnocylindria bacterium]|nr:hypothetical protein [Candidatus Limnocylindria bacterium]